MQHRCLIGAAVAAAMLNAGPALAEMDEIVVEATRRAQDLQSVPLAVSAFGTEQIAKLQIDTTQDIGDNVPNLQSSWVTMGLKIGQVALRFGCNDFGSLMIGLVHGLAREVVEAGGRAVICNASDQMQTVLRTMKIDDTLMNFNSRKVALKAVKAGG